MEVIKQIKMDLQNKQNVPVIDAVQGDGNTRVLEFSLYSGGVAWNVPDVVSVAVAYMRPDGAKGIYDTLADGSSAVSVSGNSVSAVIVPQAVSVDGDTKLTVVLTNDAGEQLATFGVVLRVEYNPAVGAVEPEDYINLRQVLVEMIEKVMGETGALPDFSVWVVDNGDGSGSADERVYDIRNAYDTGRAIHCKLETEDQYYVELPLVKMQDGIFYFSAICDGVEWLVTIKEDDGGNTVTTLMRREVGAGNGGSCDCQESTYYASIADAITDINNGVQENEVSSLVDAKVRVFTGDSGVPVVMLLTDVSVDATIDIGKDINLVLGEYKITLAAAARLNFAAGTKCSIIARGKGGITKSVVEETTTGIYLVAAHGDSLIVDGGTYTISGVDTVGCIAFASASDCKYLKMDNCTVSAKNAIIQVSGDHVARCVQNQAGVLVVSGCTLNVTAAGPAQCIMGYGTITVNKCDITAYSGGYAVRAVFLLPGTANICDSNISATTASSDSYAAGIYNSGGCALTVRDTNILADAQGVSATSGSMSLACNNLGTAYFENVRANGTHSGIQSTGKLYVSGGVYTGYCHGGFYLAHGAEGEAYINDATIRSGNYEGMFDYSDMTGLIYGSMYVGANDTTVYIDGCTFDPAGHHISLVLRGSNDEQNITVNISNSTLGDGGQVRVDNDTHTLNVGVGTDITTDKIVDIDGTNQPDRVVFTNKLYRKNDSAAVCKGADFKALSKYSDSQFITKPVSASVGQTIVVKAVDENGKPTEWEVADLPSGGDVWEDISSGELTEEVASIVIDKDSNGNDFNLSKGKLYLEVIGTPTNTVDRGIIKFSHNYRGSGGGVVEMTALTRKNTNNRETAMGDYDFSLDKCGIVRYIATQANDKKTFMSLPLTRIYIDCVTENATVMGVGTRWLLRGVRK